MPRPLRILIAPDAFKECMTAREAAEAIERGAKRAAESSGKECACCTCPMSDGGAGLVDAVVETGWGERRLATVSGPLGDPVQACFALGEGERRTKELPRVEVVWGSFCAGAFAAVAFGVLGPFGAAASALVGAAVAIGILSVDWVLRAADDRKPLELAPIAVLELSSAAGLSHVPPGRRDPERSTTYGVGELILAAIDEGVRQIFLGIGNSATCDAGAGLAAALGVRFFDHSGVAVPRLSGADLSRIARIDTSAIDQRVRGCAFSVLCDVDNPLFGPEGAAHVFAPQKGATQAQVERLDAGLRNFAKRCEEAGIGVDPTTRGMGAAGGAGFAMAAFCNASLGPGAEYYLCLIRYREYFHPADLVLTGAGKLDATDLRGKALLAVAKAAAEFRKPTIALVGSAGPGADDCLATRPDGSPGLEGGLHAYHVITPPGMPLDEALRRGPELLEAAAERVVRDWLTRR